VGGGPGRGALTLFAYLSITYLAISYLLFRRSASTIKEKTPHMAGLCFILLLLTIHAASQDQ
jgi:hypothetical protein